MKYAIIAPTTMVLAMKGEIGHPCNQRQRGSNSQRVHNAIMLGVLMPIFVIFVDNNFIHSQIKRVLDNFRKTIHRVWTKTSTMMTMKTWRRKNFRQHIHQPRFSSHRVTARYCIPCNACKISRCLWTPTFQPTCQIKPRN